MRTLLLLHVVMLVKGLRPLHSQIPEGSSKFASTFLLGSLCCHTNHPE
jgi:hypothetical protein